MTLLLKVLMTFLAGHDRDVRNERNKTKRDQEEPETGRCVIWTVSQSHFNVRNSMLRSVSPKRRHPPLESTFLKEPIPYAISARMERSQGGLVQSRRSCILMEIQHVNLYYMGLYGLIEERLCSPMQDALGKGCGCGIYDPDYTPSLPLPSPTDAPSSSTTLEATVRPKNKITSRPTHAPTSAPSSAPTSKPTISPTMLAPVLEVKNGPTKGTTVPQVLPTTFVVKRSSSSQSSKDDNAYKIGTFRVRGGNRG
jgi:hypothetical protein